MRSGCTGLYTVARCHRILQCLPFVLCALESAYRPRADRLSFTMQVILALQRLVNALGSESPATYPVLLPALQYATDPGGPEALALLEDGLDTLLTALRCAPGPAPGLLALFPHLTAAMEQSTGMRVKVGVNVRVRVERQGCSDRLGGGVGEGQPAC